ncbi:MAG: hypothetical protein AAGC73_06085, partial [Verrucomicrobiota bacterium]
LDNKALQLLFLEYRGDSNEAKCFKALMSDLLLIAANESSGHDDTPSDFWNSILDDWTKGIGSERNRSVYLNCLPHDVAKDLQRLSDQKKFICDLKQAQLSINQIHLDSYLDLLNSMSLKLTPMKSFRFDAIFREKFLSEEERFSGVPNSILDKLHANAEASKANNNRISRSVLASAYLSEEIGVKSEHLLSRAEYDAICPILGHYHHYAFTESLGLKSFVSHRMPSVSVACADRLAQESQRIAGSSSRQTKMNIPISNIAFEDINKVRLGTEEPKFRESLARLNGAAYSGDIEQTLSALESHAKHIEKVVSLSFKGVKFKELGNAVIDTIHLGDPSSAGIAKLVCSYLGAPVQVLRNVRKEYQLRLFFRGLIEQYEVAK